MVTYLLSCFSLLVLSVAFAKLQGDVIIGICFNVQKVILQS